MTHILHLLLLSANLPMIHTRTFHKQQKKAFRLLDNNFHLASCHFSMYCRHTTEAKCFLSDFLFWSVFSPHLSRDEINDTYIFIILILEAVIKKARSYPCFTDTRNPRKKFVAITQKYFILFTR